MILAFPHKKLMHHLKTQNLGGQQGKQMQITTNTKP
jgi:hypothetical protein